MLEDKVALVTSKRFLITFASGQVFLPETCAFEYLITFGTLDRVCNHRVPASWNTLGEVGILPDSRAAFPFTSRMERRVMVFRQL